MNYKIDQQLQKIKTEKDVLKELSLIKVLKDELLLEILENEENRIRAMDEKVVKFKKKDFTPLFEKLLTTNPRFDDTEKKIMKDLYSLGDNITILIISHRYTILEDCKKILNLKNGRIDELVNYKDFIRKKASDIKNITK